MSAHKEERDPLSLLAESSSSGSECEDDNTNEKRLLKEKSYYTSEEIVSLICVH